MRFVCVGLTILGRVEDEHLGRLDELPDVPPLDLRETLALGH